jgi:hypothetical protein
MLNFIKICLLAGLLGGGWTQARGDESPAAPGAPSGAKQEIQASRLAGLRDLNEGAVFLLQRYATLDALVGALQAGRPENQAFAIGAASVVPGAGQFINGAYTPGALMLLGGSVAGINANQLAFSRRRPRHPEWGLAYYSSELLRNSVMLYATLHAANASYRARADRSAALWTGAASVVPGAGQAVNHDWWEAAGFLGAYALSAALAADMENRFYAPADKAPGPVSDQSISWSLAILPTGLAVNATW